MDQGNERIREPKMTPKRKKLVSPISWKNSSKKEKEPWKRSQENTGNKNFALVEKRG